MIASRLGYLLELKGTFNYTYSFRIFASHSSVSPKYCTFSKKKKKFSIREIMKTTKRKIAPHLFNTNFHYR